MKCLLFFLFFALIGCSSKKDDPAAPSQPVLSVASGGMVAYVNGTATTFTAVRASFESDATESRYYVGGTLPNGTLMTVKCVIPAGQPVPTAHEQDMVLYTYTPVPNTAVANVYGAGHGVITVARLASSAGKNYSGSFSGTVNGYKVEGGLYKDVLGN